MRRSNWSTTWRDVVVPLGFGHLRFHDLRHTGNTLAAATGASTRELMARMGHSSARAALLYQHATVERELQIADKLNDMIVAARSKATSTGETLVASVVEPERFSILGEDIEYGVPSGQVGRPVGDGCATLDSVAAVRIASRRQLAAFTFLS